MMRYKERVTIIGELPVYRIYVGESDIKEDRDSWYGRDELPAYIQCCTPFTLM